MQTNTYIMMIFGMLIVTFLPRFLPLYLLDNRELPELVVRWLRYIPAAVLSALLAPTIIINNGRLDLALSNTALLAFFPTLIIAYLSRNIFYTVSGGLLYYLLIGYLF